MENKLIESLDQISSELGGIAAQLEIINENLSKIWCYADQMNLKSLALSLEGILSLMPERK